MLYLLPANQTKLFFVSLFPIPLPSLPRPRFLSLYPEITAGIAVLALSAPLNAEFAIPVADPPPPLPLAVDVVIVKFEEAVVTVTVVILLLPFAIGIPVIEDDDGIATGPRSTLAADGNCTSEDSGAAESGGKDEFAILVPASPFSPVRRSARSAKWPPTTGRALKKMGFGETG